MGRITAITMPKFGLAMTEGKIASWAKDEGEVLTAGEELADVETSKITNAYESPVAGVLRRRVAPVQEDLPVGALIAVVADADVPDAEIEAFISGFSADVAVSDSDDAAAPEPRQIAIPGGEIRVVETGVAQDGVAVVLIHGFAGDGGNWLFNQPALSEHHRVVALDLPGHGGSTKQLADATVPGLAASVRAALDALDVDRVHLVGHSLGGAVALQVALDAPARVGSLSLIAPAGLGERVNQAFIDGVLSASRHKQMQPVLETLFADPALVSRDMVENMLRSKRLDGAPEALAAIAAASLPGGRQTVRLRDRLGALAGIPVQVIWGEKDAILSADDADGLPETIAVHRLAGAGHMPQMEKAAEVNRLLNDFIDGRKA